LSLPAMTSARSTPGSGAAIVVMTKLSHFPRRSLTSSLPEATSASISALLPSVPTITTAGAAGGVVDAVGR
jgi:hypothetical protein